MIYGSASLSVTRLANFAPSNYAPDLFLRSPTPLPSLLSPPPPPFPFSGPAINIGSPDAPRLLILARRRVPVNKTQLFRNPLFSLFLPGPICRSICTAAKSIRACVFREPSLPREREERSPSRRSVPTRAASTYTSIYEVMKRIRSESRIFSSPLASLR